MWGIAVIILVKGSWRQVDSWILVASLPSLLGQCQASENSVSNKHRAPKEWQLRFFLASTTTCTWTHCMHTHTHAHNLFSIPSLLIIVVCTLWPVYPCDPVTYWNLLMAAAFQNAQQHAPCVAGWEKDHNQIPRCSFYWVCIAFTPLWSWTETPVRSF